LSLRQPSSGTPGRRAFLFDGGALSITTASGQDRFSLWIDGAIDGSDSAIVRRILGYMLMTAMPSQALPEALDALRGIYDFHAENARLARQLPPPIATRSVSGRIVARSERPDLVLAE
jgi:hypothetical protein